MSLVDVLAMGDGDASGDFRFGHGQTSSFGKPVGACTILEIQASQGQVNSGGGARVENTDLEKAVVYLPGNQF